VKQRKLTPIQTRALMRKVQGIQDVVYEATQALAYATVGAKNYRLVYDNNLKFTGLAHRLY
jgi:hypothetical protein